MPLIPWRKAIHYRDDGSMCEVPYWGSWSPCFHLFQPVDNVFIFITIWSISVISNHMVTSEEECVFWWKSQLLTFNIKHFTDNFPPWHYNKHLIHHFLGGSLCKHQWYLHISLSYNLKQNILFINLAHSAFFNVTGWVAIFIQNRSGNKSIRNSRDIHL